MAWDFFRPSAKTGGMRIPITPVEAQRAGRAFQHRREWDCPCGAQLKIRGREDRSSGPSNFQPFPVGHAYAGHSQVSSGALSWNGLAEERGWKTDPVKCPACQHGVSVEGYRQARRDGTI